MSATLSAPTSTQASSATIRAISIRSSAAAAGPGRSAVHHAGRQSGIPRPGASGTAPSADPAPVDCDWSAFDLLARLANCAATGMAGRIRATDSHQEADSSSSSSASAAHRPPVLQPALRGQPSPARALRRPTTHRSCPHRRCRPERTRQVDALPLLVLPVDPVEVTGPRRPHRTAHDITFGHSASAHRERHDIPGRRLGRRPATPAAPSPPTRPRVLGRLELDQSRARPARTGSSGCTGSRPRPGTSRLRRPATAGPPHGRPATARCLPGALIGCSSPSSSTRARSCSPSSSSTGTRSASWAAR